VLGNGKPPDGQIARRPGPMPEPHVIQRDAVYFLGDLRELGLKASSVRREHRLGRLRVGKRLGKTFVLGQWLWQWLEDGELKRSAKAEVVNGHAKLR
jgi:hypothetical protein